ncbi:ABC transporter ATP-binding protein [Halogranum rubrum]|uniref:Oligopeptide/dipeptide ABC transporter, ATPase subunit n=1 Tax=Halogranum salarium B-1 TaxID=1210908 RepID=J3EST3_9EURY|nr:ABC transporter ATP-binding protein [Halogranum salarium]EJN57052.1 oligopeptide/dipeptide ABC transporter, ATPase subunit [Halogranum salarium B-1]
MSSDRASTSTNESSDSTTGSNLLEVRSLKTQFPTSRGTVTAVDGVDLTVERGEILGLVGESGSGKSVFAQSIMGIVDDPGRIVDGDIQLAGESLLDKSAGELEALRGGRLSMIFQDPMNSLNPTLTVGEQIAETVRLHQDVGESVSLPAELKRKLLGATKNSEAWRRAIEMLEAVEIPEAESRAGDYPHEFSGGMRQRAMIAMALSCEPDLLIADEPTTALDVTVQAQILDELRDLKDTFDTSILLITHDLAVVSEVCDRVAVMYAGEIVERASARELFSNPQHPYTQGLIASTPRLDAPDDELTPIQGNVPDLIDIPYACHFAPRCPEAERECFEVDPDFREVGEGDHEAACLRRGPEERRL